MTADRIREILEHCPTTPATQAPDLRGVRHDGMYLCRTCSGRLLGRGVLLRPLEIVWEDEPGAPKPCAGCEEVQP